MSTLKSHEIQYIQSRGIEESVFSKNAYIPKELHVGSNVYAFYLNREEEELEVLTVFGNGKSERLSL